jgi:hypothetical protein
MEFELRPHAERRRAVAPDHAGGERLERSLDTTTPPAPSSLGIQRPASMGRRLRKEEVKAIDTDPERDRARATFRERESERAFAERSRANDQRAEFGGDGTVNRDERHGARDKVRGREERRPRKRRGRGRRTFFSLTLRKEPPPWPFQRDRTERSRRRIAEFERGARGGSPERDAEAERHRDGGDAAFHRPAPGATAMATDARFGAAPLAVASTLAT